VSIDKASFRKVSAKKLKRASLQGKKSKDHQVKLVLEQLLNDLDPSSVLFYMPFGFEIAIRSLLINEKRKIRKCYVPFMVGESFKMVPYRLPLT